MIFRRKIIIQTKDTRSKVLEKLRQVIETKDCPKPKSHYKGEFVKERFIIVTKTSAVDSFQPIWIFGEFIETQSGTNISATIQFHWSARVFFLLFNVILSVKFVIGLLRHSQDWMIFLGFLVFLWAFFLLQSRLEVNGFKHTVMPLFENSEDGK